ncbi:hypothetical protein AVEN_181240-1 [Araneus ventricosus]|uniref:Integrase catalytic domain-containing protein n=1 Tax=Araneus ventricosus TaxID=182803 RepID=A0A4Y2K7B9_ARAVE|nr:hypothetical protein AVEN_181240-1 [Araneus ventricosus]
MGRIVFLSHLQIRTPWHLYRDTYISTLHLCRDILLLGVCREGRQDLDSSAMWKEAVKETYVDDDQKNWDNILPFVTFAYNSAKHETTGISPFYLVHGRDVETPLDATLPFLPDESTRDYVQNQMTKEKEVRQFQKNI